MFENDSLRKFVGKYYPFIIFFALMLVMHLVMGLNGDDIRYAKVLSNNTLSGYISYRYDYWSSRLVIESVLVYLSRNLIVWKVLDCVIYTLGVYYTVKLVNRGNSVHIALLGVLLFLMYPFHEMATAGWIATTLNYLWCYCLGMIAMIPLINLSYGSKTRPWVYIVSVISLIYAVNQEQSCALIFGLNLVYLVGCLMKGRKVSRYNVFVILVSLASLMFIFTCPGNEVRYAAELSYWYPQFASYGILEKIYLGVIPTFALLLEQKIIFPLFYLILCIACAVKTENRYLKYFFYLNIAFILFLAIFKTCLDISLLGSQFESLARFTSPFEAIVNVISPLKHALVVMAYETISEINPLTVLIAVYLLLASSVMLFKVFGLKGVIIFIAGFLSKFVGAFSPTVFVSGPRTMMFFYFMLIALILMIVVNLFDEDKIDERWDRLMTLSFAALAVVNYVLVFVIVFVKYGIF